MIDHIQTMLATGSISGILLAFVLVFLGGITTSLTPCIFPMIPIVFSVITGVGGESLSRKETLIKVVVYGFGLSLSYVVLGVVSVLTHDIFGSFLQSIWIKIIIANVFFLIAFNTMHWIRLPHFAHKNREMDSYLSLIVFGFLTGFTMSACTLPILAVVLAFASQTSLIMGALLLWVYAWGFFSLLFFIALFGATFKNKLPKSGPWLRKIEIALFLLCFVIAQWFLIQSGGF